jgi:hypothetical protein
MDVTVWINLFAAGFGGLAGGSLSAYFKGYLGEKGKRLATHEDIEGVLKEVRAVTHETETIKAQISADARNRETVWNQRRDIYGEVLQAIDDYRKIIGVGDPVGEAWKAEYASILARLKRLLALSHIFLGTEGRKAFSVFYGQISGLDTLDGVGAIIHTFEISLIRAARSDLRVDLE